jgi:hypothetical protein
MAPSACCLFLVCPLYHKKTTTIGRNLGFSQCIDRRHPLRRILTGGATGLSLSSQQPALIGETIETVVSKNQMIEQPDAQ